MRCDAKYSLTPTLQLRSPDSISIIHAPLLRFREVVVVVLVVGVEEGEGVGREMGVEVEVEAVVSEGLDQEGRSGRWMM